MDTTTGVIVMLVGILCTGFIISGVRYHLDMAGRRKRRPSKKYITLHEGAAEDHYLIEIYTAAQNADISIAQEAVSQNNEEEADKP